jgi:hypothetical protein
MWSQPMPKWMPIASGWLAFSCVKTFAECGIAKRS